MENNSVKETEKLESIKKGVTIVNGLDELKEVLK